MKKISAKKKTRATKAAEYRVGDRMTLRGVPEECKERTDPEHKPKRCPICNDCEIELVRQLEPRTFQTAIITKGMGGAGVGRMTTRDFEKYRKGPIVRAKTAPKKTPRKTASKKPQG
jgi:hypothetical protein